MSTPPPYLTPQQRQAALAKAAVARHARHVLLARVKAGDLTLAEVLAKADAGDEVVRRTRVLALLKAMPGHGLVRAAQLLQRANIAESRRIGGLGARQRHALQEALH